MDPHHSGSQAWTRRGFLGLTAGATLGAYGLSLGLAADVPSAFDGRNFQLRAPEPAPKRGGVLRYGVLSAPAHFDVHQSGTAANMCSQGCMYDNLIRRDPRDSGQSIIPDLAHSWEVSADKQTYTFLLRKGVKFHDGGEFTAEDVKATYQRIIWPPAGVSIPRTPLFAAVSEINVRDPYVIEFKLSEARPEKFMLGAFASGWNIIVRKQTLEENNYNLRQVMNYPGTGPFRHVKRVDKEVWVMERNPDYWNEGLPYLLDPVTGKKVQATPGMSSTAFYQSVIQAVWVVNNAKKPFDDPRVRRALHLALNRPTLVDVVQDVAPMMVGGFLYPFSEFATPADKMAERPGYQADATAASKEARQLLAAAGYPQGLKNIDFMVRDINTFKLWSVAIQAMLKEALNIDSTLRTVQVSVWFDEAQVGNFDLTISAIVSTLIDPSDYFNSWYRKNGPQNYSKWHNQAFQALLPQIDRELDETKRKALIREGT